MSHPPSAPHDMPFRAHNEAREAARALLGGASAPRRGHEPEHELASEELVSQIDRQLAGLDRLRAARDAQAQPHQGAAGELDEHTARLTHLRDQLQSHRHSPASLVWLRGQVMEGLSAATSAIRSAEGGLSGGVGGAAHTIAGIMHEQARLASDTTHWLAQTRAGFETRTRESASLAAAHHIDVSHEQEIINDARKHEDAAKDPFEKLGWRIKGLQSEVGMHHKILDSGDLTPPERAKEQHRSHKAEEELRQAEKKMQQKRGLDEKLERARQQGGSLTPGQSAAAGSLSHQKRDRDHQEYAHLLKDEHSVHHVAGYLERRGLWKPGETHDAKDEARPVLADANAHETKGEGAKAKPKFASDLDSPAPTKAADAGDAQKKPEEKTHIALSDKPEAHHTVEAPNTPAKPSGGVSRA